jgi:signal transduction histidine kinase
LQSETDSLLAAITQGGTGLYLDRRRIDADYDQPYSGRYFVIDAGERWRSRSLWDARLPLDADGLHNTLVSGPNDQQLLVWSGRYQVHGQAVDISVAIDYQPLIRSFDRARWMLWLLGGLTIALALLVQRWLLHRALLPLHRVRSELAGWPLGERLELSEQVPEELEPLVNEINHLGRQVDQIIKRLRSGQADLGHALKTPLAIAVSLLQSVGANPDPETLNAIAAQLQSIRNLMDRALQRGRLAPESHASQRFDAGQDLPWLLDSLRCMHGEELTLDMRLESGAQRGWPFEREDMLELLGNLLDNACKWARHRVVLDAALNPQGLSLSVADDGPGVAEADRLAILSRGHRLDENIDGDGLGLAIVRDLVDAYQGRLTLAESIMGGLRVELFLPVAPRAPRSDV